MKYLYNPVTGALDDVETPNLGEKYFASAETDEIIKKIDNKFGPGTLFPASEAPTPPKTKDRDMFDNAFAELPSAADLSVDPIADSDRKLNEVIAAYERYRGGRKNPVINFNKFFEIYARENFADGQLVQPSGDGSRPGYSGKYGPNIRKLTQSDSLEVQVVRGGTGGGKGGQKFYKTFNFDDYGSEAKALKAAEDYRDSIPKIKKDTGKQSKGLPIGFKKQTGGQAEIRKALNDIIKVGGKSFSNEDIRKLIDTDLFPNDDQFRKAVDVVKKEPDFKNLTFEKKPRPRLKNDPVSVLQAATAKRRGKKIDILGSKDYEKELYKYKKEIQEALGLEKYKTSGSISGKPRELLPIEMGHQSSIKQLSLLKQKMRPEDLSPQNYEVNRKGVKKNKGGVQTLEDNLNKKFYPEQKKLYIQAKKFIDAGKTVPADLQNKIVSLNEDIQKFVDNTVKKYPLLKDRVNPITIDANDLTVKRGDNVFKQLGIGLVDQNLGDIKIGSIDDLTIKANLAQQTFREAVDAGLIDEVEGQKKLDKFLNSRPIKDADKLPSNRKQLIVSGFRNKIANFFQDAPVPKGVKLPIGATAAALDFAIFNGLMGMPAPEAMLGSSQWLLKNPEAAEKIGKSINLVIEGKMTVDSFFNKNSEELGGVFKDLVGIDMPDAYSKDDEVGNQRLQEMDAAMAVPNLKEMPSTDIDETTAAPLYDFATGGRVNFANGTPNPQLEGDDFLNELEFKFNNIDSVTLDDTPITFDDSKSSAAQVADLFNPKNIPYYADMAVRAGLRVGEFGTRILPATGQLISDVLQKPMFKVKSSYAREDDNEILDYGETPENNNVKFVGGPIFKNFLKNITPTSTEKLVGLDTLINEEKKKMIERGSSSLPVKVAETAALGGELIAPIFPGLKLLRAYAKSKSLPVNDDTKQLLEQDVDMVLESNGIDRRQFLQMTGAGGTVILAKMLGFGDEMAVATKATEKATAEVAKAVPPYFFDLVDIIKKKGFDVTKKSATQDLMKVYKYKGYEVYEDLATGEIRIEKGSSIRTDDDALQILEYKPGQADETTKGKPADNYEEVTEVKYGDPNDMDRPLEEIEDGVDLDAILEFIKNEKIN